jgi:hypothetical protein
VGKPRRLSTRVLLVGCLVGVAPALAQTPPVVAPAPTPAVTPEPAAMATVPAPAPLPAPVTAPTIPSTIPPPSVHGGVRAARVAIMEFQVQGSNASPTLSMQLQDGFVVGLTRAAPIYVLDSVDVTRYMDTFPELQKCEGSICFKRYGQLLDVSHLLIVKVTVNGNSYTMNGRLLSTETASPADVPVATETRFCNVCTVDDAKQKMLQLGDDLRRPIESWLDAWRPPPPPPPPPRSWRRPIAAVAVATGFTTAVAGGALFANTASKGERWKAGVAGLLAGVGVSMASVGCYVLIALPIDPQKTAALSITAPF